LVYAYREEVAELNAKNDKTYQESLVPCPNCSRTFMPDRLVVHKRACRPKGGTASHTNMNTERSRTATKKDDNGNQPPVSEQHYSGEWWFDFQEKYYYQSINQKWHLGPFRAFAVLVPGCIIVCTKGAQTSF
jgi:hypothetical protein